jgi:hypothetical protein
MISKPKILFVYDHPKPTWWQDGAIAALDLLEEDFEIVRVNIHSRPLSQAVSDKGIIWGPDTFDFVLGWGAFSGSVDKEMQSVLTKKGLYVAGSISQPYGARNYDVLFVETDWSIHNYLPDHPNKRKAFGINANIFHSSYPTTPIIWDYIGAGALAAWKRWRLMAHKPGRKLVVGDYQVRNETESLNIARELLLGDVMVSNQMPPEQLVQLMKMSRVAYIPAEVVGGGERFLWEAKACGLQVEIEDDNPKLKELLHDDVKDHYEFARQLKEGIESVL